MEGAAPSPATAAEKQPLVSRLLVGRVHNVATGISLFQPDAAHLAPRGQKPGGGIVERARWVMRRVKDGVMMRVKDGS